VLLKTVYPAEGLLSHRSTRSFRFDSILSAQRDRPEDLIRGSLDVEPEVHHIAVFHDVVFALKPHLAGFF
jgi:hypothetical protein